MQPSTTNPRRWWALVVLAGAQFVVILDTSIIGVALPDIQKAFGFSQFNLSWLFNAYVIAFGGLLDGAGIRQNRARPRRVSHRRRI